MKIIYFKCGRKHDDVKDHRSNVRNLSSCEGNLKKSGLYGNQTQDPVLAGAVLYQLSEQAYWELVILSVGNKRGVMNKRM